MNYILIVVRTKYLAIASVFSQLILRAVLETYALMC
jgi:hypothetical protein